MTTRVLGIISDTHGLMRPQALKALAGVELIIHAGDVGGDGEILDALRAIAPVHAVRGNIDMGQLGKALPETAVVEGGGVKLYVLHIVDTLAIDPMKEGYAAVIYGHSHKPATETRNGVLYLNPGSAGPRRFTLPVSLMRLHIEDGVLRPELVTLEV
jgi:putative phosphoesterase